MKLSIITINRNNAEGLSRTIESVLSQTYRDIEYIVIDGASTDGSVDVIRASALQAEGLDMKWISEPDKGIYDAMNKGVKRATGDYVFILNSGDMLAGPEVTARMIAALNDGVIDILLGNIVQVYADGKKRREIDDRYIDDRLTPRPIESSMLTFYKGTIPHDAAFVRRELFEKYGYFDDKLKICADWKLYLDMIALGGVQPWYVDIDVVLFDMSGVSNTNNERRLVERMAYLEQILPASVRKDYDAYSFPIEQYKRLNRHHLWGIVYFIERVLFKLEKWHILR